MLGGEIAVTGRVRQRQEWMLARARGGQFAELSTIQPAAYR
jgi:hypothetical protein